MTPVRLGQFIGPFELGGPLGEGRMAIVYHAWHHRDRAPVAIKVLKSNDLHEVSLDQRQKLGQPEKAAGAAAALRGVQ